MSESTLTITNPERLEQARENVAKVYAQIVENRMNKMRQEALKAQDMEETQVG